MSRIAILVDHMKAQRQTFIIDAQSREILEQWSKDRGLSMSAGLRLVIRTHCNQSLAVAEG